MASLRKTILEGGRVEADYLWTQINYLVADVARVLARSGNRLLARVPIAAIVADLTEIRTRAAAAIVDISATLKQYEDAKIALKEAAKEAAAEGLPGLAGRLSNLAKVAERRRSDAFATALPGYSLAEGLGIATVTKQNDALTNANPTTAGPPSGETPPSR